MTGPSNTQRCTLHGDMDFPKNCKEIIHIIKVSMLIIKSDSVNSDIAN